MYIKNQLYLVLDRGWHQAFVYSSRINENAHEYLFRIELDAKISRFTPGVFYKGSPMDLYSIPVKNSKTIYKMMKIKLGYGYEV